MAKPYQPRTLLVNKIVHTKVRLINDVMAMQFVNRINWFEDFDLHMCRISEALRHLAGYGFLSSYPNFVHSG